MNFHPTVMERTPEGRARLIVFDVDEETGALCVMDIIESADNNAWYIALTVSHNYAPVVRISKDAHVYMAPQRFKTRNATVKELLRLLDQHYPGTGLDLSRPTFPRKSAK